MAVEPEQTPPMRPWDKGVAPGYITLFLWVAFFDQLAGPTLAVGGLGWSALGALTAGLLCYQLLYYVPAMWGLRSRRPLEEVARSTFGNLGAVAVPGGLMGIAQVVWFAVAVFYATDFTLRGLAVARLIEPKLLELVAWRGLTLRSPIFLATALVWTFSFAAVGTWALRLIEALMRVFPIFPALLLGAAMAGGLGWLGNFQPSGFDPFSGEPVQNGGPRAAVAMIQLIFAFFATAGAAATDWGVTCRDARDVRLGGLVGVAFGATILAIVPLATVAGILGKRPMPQALALELEPEADLRRLPQMNASPAKIEKVRADVRESWAAPYTFGTAVEHGIGGSWGCAILLVFGVGSMAPAVYAAHLLGARFSAIWPKLTRVGWTMAGAAASFPIVALGLPARAGPLFGIMGAAFAPVVGAIAADYVRRAGQWPGPRQGVNLAGCLAWVIGLIVGLVPLVGPLLDWGGATRFQPSAVYAFFAAFGVYSVLASIGLESPLQKNRAEVER